VDRLERLVNLVAALLEAPRPLTRVEIHDRVPGYADEDATFRRMFERDKELIRQMGIPLSVLPTDPAEPDATEGYRILKEHYELPDPGLHADELAALHLAASAVDLGGMPEGTEALWKLGGGGDTQGTAPAASRSVAIPGSAHLTVLFGAIAARQPVRFRYRGSDRTLDPYWLSFRNGRWYLAGFDHTRGEQRSFRLDRFETAPEVTGELDAFERPAGTSAGLPQPWELGEGDDRVEALLLVDTDHADWAVNEVGPDAVRERRADGAVVLALEVSNRDAFRSFVLGFLDHAEVLSPPELRKDMVVWLEELVGS
jgi:proteasome accessory factor B